MLIQSSLHEALPLAGTAEMPLSNNEFLNNRFVSPCIPRDKTIEVLIDGIGMELIGRLRYELFITRDKKAYTGADHEKRIFVETVDQSSLNFHFSTAEQCLAAVRLCWAEEALDDPHLKLVVEHSGIPASLVPKTLVTSRLAIRDMRIAKLKMVTMLREAYFIGVLSGALFCCVACRPALAALFERLGFRASGATYFDRAAGLMRVMVLDVFDAAHFEKIQSPFLVDMHQAISASKRGLA